MLHLPSEIVLEILKYAKQDIAPFLRTNSQWFHCGISIKWRVAAPEDFDTVEKHRRQVYASVIRGFRIYQANNERFEELSHLSWPGLEMLDVDFVNSARDGEPAILTDLSYLKCYLREGLRYLHLGGPFDPELLSLIQASCPQLKTFSISDPVPGITPEVLLKFLREIPSLSDIAIGSGESPLANGETIKYLAGRNNLERLSLKRSCDADVINAIDAPSPFHRLQHLAISVTEPPLSHLVGMVGGLRSFHLNLVKPGINDPDGNTEFNSVALSHISNLVELQDLSVVIWGDMPIREEDLLSLKKLTQLRRLSIYGHGPGSLRGSTINRAYFEELFSKLGKLEHLDFRVYEPEITNDSLMCLRKCCPSLRHCDIMGFFDMARFKFEKEKEPLFWKIESLSVGGFKKNGLHPTSSDPYEHVRQIERHFPNLRQLDYTFRSYSRVLNEFTEEVLEIWRMRQADRIAKARQGSKRP